jgi:hypothetical protein
MSIVRALASVAIVLFCGAFVPVGGCAKGCGKMAAREGDDIARYGTRSSLGVAGAAPYADDLARSGRYGSYGDDLSRAGRHGDDMATTHAGGAAVGDDLAGELEQSSLKLNQSQHDEVMDAVKDVGQEVLGQLVEGDDEEDEADIKRASAELEKRLKATLTRDQLRRFHAEFGTSKQLLERLVREQGVNPAGGSPKP